MLLGKALICTISTTPPPITKATVTLRKAQRKPGFVQVGVKYEYTYGQLYMYTYTGVLISP